MEGDESILGLSGNLDMGEIEDGRLGLGQTGGEGGGQLPNGDETMGFAESSPGGSIIQMAGWGQFDSLVSLDYVYERMIGCTNHD